MELFPLPFWARFSRQMIRLILKFLLVILKCPKLHSTDPSWVAKALDVQARTVDILPEDDVGSLCTNDKPLKR